ncbi:hypothetical protein V8C86DRAFT_3099482 [Haematococcus lacustris]
MVRASLLAASQCATYDEVKRGVMHNTGWVDGTTTQLACSLVTGLSHVQQGHLARGATQLHLPQGLHYQRRQQ